MQIAQVIDNVQSGGLGQGNAFSIAASAKAFEVLSSNLYQNKILAVIREISCNAADAHKAAGKPLSDIDVKLPTYTNPTFTVRDYGSGLSKDDVLELYTTYFRSTKDTSNDMIGGFGLGSKSPFAVAEQFTVTSWHGGRKMSFICYKDGGLPRVNMVGDTPSNEPSGLMVQVAAKSTEVSAWTYEADNFFKWWPVRPKTGREITDPYNPENVLVKSKDTINGFPEWVVFNATGGQNMAFMGLVPYRISLDAIPNLPDDIAKLFQGTSMVLAFEVGELSISPSREALSYDPSTCASLMVRMTAVAKSLFAEIKEAIAAKTSLYDARKYVFGRANRMSAIGDATYKAATQGKVAWQGKRVREAATLDFAKAFPGTKTTVVNYQRRTWRKTWNKTFITSDDIQHNIHWSDEEPIYYWTDNISAKTYRTLNEYYPSGNVNTYIISGPSFDDLAKEMDEQGYPPLQDLADLPEPTKAVPGANGTRSPSTKAYLWKYNNGWTRTEQTQDLRGGGVYLEFYDGDPTDKQANHYLGQAAQCGWLDTKNTRVLGLRRNHLASMRMRAQLAKEGWVPFDAAWFAKNVPVRTIEADAEAYFLQHLHLLPNNGLGYAMNSIKSELSEYAKSHSDSWGDFDHIKDVLKLTRSWNFIYELRGHLPFQNWLTDEHRAAIDKAQDGAKLFAKEYDAFLDTNPMLKYVNQGGYGAPKLPYSDFLSYINR